MSFVDEGPAVRELYRTEGKERRSVDTGSSSPSAASSRSRPVRSAPFVNPFQGVFGECGTETGPNDSGQSRDLERSTLVSILSPTAYQSQLLSLFLSTVRSDNPLHVAPKFTCHSIWLAQLASRTEVSSTLLYAIRAISLSFLGRQTRDENLIQNSRLLYGKTLLKLNRALQDPAEGLGSDTLSATILLTFYEMLNCTEHNSWVRHAGGAAHLIQLRGVARHQTEFDKAIFLACRYSIVLQSYQTGKPCFLSLAPWRKLSQDIYDTSPMKSAFEDAREAFFQEIVHHPGFVKDSVDYMVSGGGDHSVLQDLVRRGHMHRSHHKAIFNRCSEALREAGQEPREVPSSVDDKVFPVVYHFPGLLVASCFCTYWSLLQLLNIALIGIEAKLSAMESGCPKPQGGVIQARMLAARKVELSRENLTNVDVKVPTTPPDMERGALASKNRIGGSGDAMKAVPNQNLPSPVTDRTMSTRSSEQPILAASSPTDYPTMSPSDTSKRRQMYFAENKHSARQICKSVEDVCTAVFLGPVFLIFSLRVVGRMLDRPDEKEWVLQKLEMLGETWGIAKDEADSARGQNPQQGFYGRVFGDVLRGKGGSGLRGVSPR